jgi:hypothetical protein
MNTTAAIAREPWRPSQASAADMALRTGMVGKLRCAGGGSPSRCR